MSLEVEENDYAHADAQAIKLFFLSGCSLQNRPNFGGLSSERRPAPVTRDGLDANLVARDSRTGLAVCFTLACKTQQYNASFAG